MTQNQIQTLLNDFPRSFFSDKDYPFTCLGHNYAHDILEGKVLAGKFVIAACNRYLEDLRKSTGKDGLFTFNPEKSERFLRIAQKFKHIKGHWANPYIIFEPWQNFFFMNIYGWLRKDNQQRRFRTAHLQVARGNGKALPVDTIIPTSKGFKKFGQLKEGDTLFSSDGSTCKVVAKNNTHLPSAYKLYFSDNTSQVASANHLWKTSNKTQRARRSRHKRLNSKKGNFVYETNRTTAEMAKDFKINGEANYSIENCGSIRGRSRNLLIDPYLLGYWLGNGDTAGSRITINKWDYLAIKEHMNNNGIELGNPYFHNNCYTQRAVGLIDGLRKLCLVGNKHIPERYIFSAEGQRRELLRGLLDSDGTIGKNKKTLGKITFAVVKEDLAKGVYELVCSLGIKATLITKDISHLSKRNPVEYQVSFTPRDDYKYFSLERKNKYLIKERGKYSFVGRRYINKIEEVSDKVPMFCIEVDSIDGTFLIGRNFLPTHNSAISSQAGLFQLSLDNPQGNEIYSAATGKDQARIVLDSARAMAMGNKKFLKATGTRVLAHSILHEKSNSFFRALSSDSNTLDGLIPALAIIDELHAHKNRKVYDVIDSAMSKRRDSLLLIITTAGFDTEGVGADETGYAKKVVLGETVDDSYFAMVYTLDEEDDWADEANWLKSNPNLGVSVDGEQLKSKCNKAKESPSSKNNFLVKHLNIWVNAHNSFFDRKKWDSLGSDIKLADYLGEKCFCGIDLSSKVDLTSFAYVFYKDKKFHILTENFVPKQTVAESSNDSYVKWVEQGHLIATNGNAINYPYLQEKFVGHTNRHKVEETMYDPWSATEFAQRMIQKRIEMIEFRMNTSNLSEPMKKLDALIREGDLVHDGNPLVSWAIGNVVAKYDANENVFPRKESERLKIDPIISIIMAIAAWIKEIEENSVYEKRGLIIL